jgi:nickel transport protein
MIAVALLVGIPNGQALAHKLQVFAFSEGAHIDGSTYFAGGGAASGARIEVRDATGLLLAELTPDEEGKFAYEAQAPIDHRILAVTSDGHQAEWRVSADELCGGFVAATRPGGSVETRSGAPDAVNAEMRRAVSPSPVDAALDPAIEAAIERAVARQIRPLREQLVAAEDALRLRDILGGLGYILGLTGLALWWRARKASTGR